MYEPWDDHGNANYSQISTTWSGTHQMSSVLRVSEVPFHSPFGKDIQIPIHKTVGAPEDLRLDSSHTCATMPSHAPLW